MSTNEDLRKYMAEHKLTRKSVAILCRCASKSTVDRWLLPPTLPDGTRNPGYRAMPAARMDLMKMAREAKLRSERIRTAALDREARKRS